MTRTQTHPIRLRWAIGLVVLGLLAVLLPAQRAAADHTPIPTAGDARRFAPVGARLPR